MTEDKTGNAALWNEVSRLRAINAELVEALKAVKPHSPPSWQVEIAAALDKARGDG